MASGGVGPGAKLAGGVQAEFRSNPPSPNPEVGEFKVVFCGHGEEENGEGLLG